MKLLPLEYYSLNPSTFQLALLINHQKKEALTILFYELITNPIATQPEGTILRGFYYVIQKNRNDSIKLFLSQSIESDNNIK